MPFGYSAPPRGRMMGQRPQMKRPAPPQAQRGVKMGQGLGPSQNAVQGAMRGAFNPRSQGFALGQQKQNQMGQMAQNFGRAIGPMMNRRPVDQGPAMDEMSGQPPTGIMDRVSEPAVPPDTVAMARPSPEQANPQADYDRMINELQGAGRPQPVPVPEQSGGGMGPRMDMFQNMMRRKNPMMQGGGGAYQY